MPDPSACPVCGYAFQGRNELAETRGKCPNCGVILQIPSPDDSAPRKRATRFACPGKPSSGQPAVSPAPRIKSAPAAATPDDRIEPKGPVGESQRPTVPRSERAHPDLGPRWLRIPAWAWVALAILALAAIAGFTLYARYGPAPSTPVASSDSPVESSGTTQSATDRQSEVPVEAAADNQTAIDEQPGKTEPAGKPVEPPAAAKESPDRPDPHAPPQAKVAKSLEEVLEAIVKFEVPVVGEARMQYGCGFVIHGRGWIATNDHVVAPATTAARVTFANGRQYKLAGILARSPEHDLAIVQLEGPPPGLTVLDLSQQETPRLASEVYAFGHPYNVDFSLSQGIVSRVLTTEDFSTGGPSRIVPGTKFPSDLVWIQHDAKISPGNSGGPLLAADGKVIGVNTFVNLKAEFGFASHVKYLRELAAAASGQLAPLPPAKRIVISAPRMKALFEASAAFGWTPRQLEQYQTLADLARQMTLAKHVRRGAKPGQPLPEAVRGLMGVADQLFLKLRGVGWGPDQFKAINQFAVGEVDNVGQGTMMLTSVAAGVGNALLLQVEGTQEHVLVPVGPQLSKSPRGTRWLLIGIISPQKAHLTTRSKPEPQRLPIVLTHYMLRVK